MTAPIPCARMGSKHAPTLDDSAPTVAARMWLCLRCGHTWRGLGHYGGGARPKRCAACVSPNWWRPPVYRKRGSAPKLTGAEKLLRRAGLLKGITE